MRSSLTIRLAAAWLLLALTFSAAAETKAVRLEKIERQIFRLVNEARAERGLPPLQWSEKLGEASAAHLVLMMAKRSLAHRYPGEPDLTHRIAATGLRFNASAENLAYATEWADLHPGLMESPGHRKNILSPKYDAIGIAVALGSNGYYAVQNFAHTTSEFDSGEAEKKFAAAARQRLNPNLEVIFSQRIRQAVCEMADRDLVEARRLPVEPPRRRMFAYTAVEPEDLPQALLNAEGGVTAKTLEVGICYKVTEKYPGGSYWVGVVY